MLSVQELQMIGDQYDQENKCKFIYKEASENFNEVEAAKGRTSNFYVQPTANLKEYQGLENLEKSISNVKKENQKRLLSGDISTGCFLDIEKFVMGELIIKCAYCGAVRFPEQKGRTVHSC